MVPPARRRARPQTRQDLSRAARLAGVVAAAFSGVAAAANPLLIMYDPAAELRTAWNIEAIGASALHARGITGKGVLVAVPDGGVDPYQTDIRPNLSPKATDITGLVREPYGTRHGTASASVIAATRNGFGTIGVAPEAKILAIRVDNAARCGGCDFRSEDLAKAIRYAIQNGAKAISLSIVGERKLQPVFEAALAEAAAADVVVFIAAGNDGDPAPSWPAQYAADPRFEGMVIAVGAMRRDGKRLPASAKAGFAQRNYVMAPGDDVPVDCAPVCQRVGLTSVSAPHGAGALALLLQAYPKLTAREAADVLLSSARDLGQRGTDRVYGRGAIDLVAAAAEAGRRSAAKP